MLNSKIQYALILLKELKDAQTVGNLGPVALPEIATKHGLKLEFLEQVARKLRISGHIKSTKGPGGGFQLASFKGTLQEVLISVHTGMTLKQAASGKEAQKYIKSVFGLCQRSIYDLELP